MSIKACSSEMPASCAVLRMFVIAGLSRNDVFKQLAPANAFLSALRI